MTSPDLPKICKKSRKFWENGHERVAEKRTIWWERTSLRKWREWNWWGY